MNRNYLIASYWKKGEKNLCAYQVGTVIHYGEEKEAEALLKYVKEKEPLMKWFILWIDV